MTPQGRAFTFNKKLWSIFLMKATLSAKLLLIAGMAIQANAVHAQTENNNNTAESTEPVSVNQPPTTQSENEIVDSTTSIVESDQDEFFEQNSALDQELYDQGTLEQLEKENAALDEMLEKPDDENIELSEADSQNAEIIETEATNVTSEGTENVTLEDMSVEESIEITVEENTTVDKVMSELNREANNTKDDQVSQQANVAPYNFERSSGDAVTFIPLMSDANVFAEFIDRLPAVVNYFTFASEEEIINFYNNSFGEPIGQERKRTRLTVSYYLDGIATRVVISEQDERRQVDVLQEESK